MFRRLRAAVLGIVLVLPILVAMPSAAQPPAQALAQTLTWTADDDTTRYVSAPTTAVAGATTLVFQNNAVNMPHTVTFDTSTPGYNHDVSANLFASPGDRAELQVTLTPGKYRYYCAVPGHTLMVGEFTVTGDPDTTPPTVTADITGDRDPNGNYLGSATINLAATDTQSGVDRIEYSLDGGAFTRYTAPVVVSTVGSHMVHYRATDVAGNTSPEQMRSFTVVPRPDTTPPTVTAEVTGDREPDGDYIGQATVTITATDTESGVATVEYEVDDTGFQPYTAPVVITAVGDHRVQYRATDRAGNVSPIGSTPAFRIVEAPPVDTTPPTTDASVAGDRDPNGNYLGSATVTITASDTQSGVDRIEYSLDGAALVRYTAPVVVNTVGTHTVTYRATDGRGNTAPDKTLSFTIVQRPDTTPPTVSAEAAGDRDPNGNYLGSATVTITASDTESGVDRIEYNLDGGAFTPYTAPVVVNTVGAHMVHYRATDRAGNTSPERMLSFTVVQRPDTTPPAVSAVVTGDREPDGDYIGSALVTLSATDAESGVDRIEYSLDGGPFVRYTEPVLVNTAGAHMVHYRAVDRAGNTSPERMESFTVVPSADTTPPTTDASVAGDREPDGDYIGRATVTITATDTQSGVDRIEYAVDSGGFVRYTTPVVVDVLGPHTVRYRATDVAGNTAAEKSVSFTVVQPTNEDTIPPTTSAQVSGNRDTNGNYIDTATVTITATDNQSGVDTIEYAVDGGAFVPYTEPVRVDTAGNHTVRYRATDVAGNTAAEQSVTFRIVEPGPDACPNSDTRATVIIDDYDTKVSNVDTGDGCTINDLIDEDAEYPDHASFVRHVDHVTDRLVTQGILTSRDQGSIVRAAARSDIGN